MNGREQQYHQRLGQRIKKARKAAGLTQEQLAQFLDIKRTGLTNKELGIQKVSAWEIVTICKICKISPDELLSLDFVATNDEPESPLSKMGVSDRVLLW